MQYRLRTLLIVLAVGPIIGAWSYREAESYLERQRKEASNSVWIDVGGPGSIKEFSTLCTLTADGELDSVQTASPDEN